MKPEILILIPHSSTKRPLEIKKSWLAEDHDSLLYSETADTDRYSERLYDFTGLINRQQLLFSISQVYLNICRRPSRLMEICPLEIRGQKIYRQKIPVSFRKRLIRKYALPYYKKIKEFNGKLILNGHTMLAGHSSLQGRELKEQIALSNTLVLGKKTRKFAPDHLMEIYAQELRTRLPKVRIGINPEIFVGVDEYLCDQFGWKRNGGGVPIIHQETDEGLYIQNDQLDKQALDQLRKAFAEALKATVLKFGSIS